MKTLTTQFTFLFIAMALHLLTGCTSTSPNVDAAFGASFNALKAQQTINPAASDNAATAVMDGQAAKEATDRYYKSYATPTPPQNVFTIGLGSGR